MGQSDARAPTPPPTEWQVVVWGEDYTEFFCDYVLQNHLCAANIPSLKNRSNQTYVIYTDLRSKEQIRASAAFRRLVKFLTVEFRCFELSEPLPTWTDGPHFLLSACQSRGMQHAASIGAACVFMGADALFGDGAMPAIERRILAGDRLVLIAGVRCDKEAMRPWFNAQRRSDDNTLPINAQAAISELRRTCAVYMDSLFINSDRFAHDLPSMYCVPVGDNSFLMRVWHMHPIMVRSDQSFEVPQTIDAGTFVGPVLQNSPNYHVFVNTDDFFVLECSPPGKIKGMMAQASKIDIEKLAQWTRINTDEVGRFCIEVPLIFDGGDTSFDAVSTADAGMKKLVDEVLEKLNHAPLKLRTMQLPSEIDRMRPTWFYGAGDLGRDLSLEMGNPASWNLLGFVDSFKTGYLNGARIFSPDQFAERVREDHQIVITSSAVAEICGILQTSGVSEAMNANVWRMGQIHNRLKQKLRFLISDFGCETDVV